MRIFLSYRRDDAGGWTTALADALQSRFGRQNVFIDVDHIHNFENFEHRIVTNIDQCDLLLAVVGKHWATIRDQDSGQRRLENPQDYVRREIARALERRVPVLPVLVDGAALPIPEDLPDDLRDLLRPNFQRLDPERWEEDLAELLRRIEVRRPSRRPVLVALLSFLIGILTGVIGSVIARKFLEHAAPSCACLDDGANPYCPAMYGYQLTGYGGPAPAPTESQQNRTAPSTGYGHRPGGEQLTPYGATGYGYPGHGYRGGIGGALL